MNFDFITIPEDEHLRLQIEEYKRIMIKNRDTIVKLREERDMLQKMNDKQKLEFILNHLLLSQVKLDDASEAAQGHFDVAIVELYKMIGGYEAKDIECHRVMNDAIEHMHLYNRI